jgi:hypothetical protein
MSVFEEVLLGRDKGRSIELQTHLGNRIENSVAAHPVPLHAALKFDRLVAQHREWIIRKPATGIYNCFGHVWAARRTAVYDKFDEAVLRVRADDGYRTVDWNLETPVPGDVVSYWETLSSYSGCVHVARVVSLRERKKLPPVIYALSKWDDVCGEVIHEVNDVPFEKIQIEYWTDRPLDQYRRGLVV